MDAESRGVESARKAEVHDGGGYDVAWPRPRIGDVLRHLRGQRPASVVKSRNRPYADVEEGHRSTKFAHLADIAPATRARLDRDATAARFTNPEPANALLGYESRKL
jgi:hypothetical protein